MTGRRISPRAVASSRGARGGCALAEVGARTSASASGGRCARTTARAATPGTTSPTTRPAPAPTAGARTGWPGSPTTSSGCASRWPCGTAHDPILKERLVRPHQQRGQPRRGRQGVLLLPRQHPDPLLHEVPVQVPPARLPLRRPGRDQPAAAAGTSWSTSCSTPGSSTRTATSTCSSSTPRPRPRTS